MPILRSPTVASVVLAVVLSVTAATALSAPSRTTAAEAQKRYRSCMDATVRDPRRALAEAKAWAKAGGGDPAQHCASAADMALGQYLEAAEGLQALARRGGPEIAANPPLQASLWGQAAHAFLAADRPEQAEAAAAAGSALVPRDPGLLVLRARARAAQGRFGDAALDLDRAIALDPKLVEAYVFRASALRRQGILDQAVTDLDKALALDADQPEALLERGIVRRLKGDDTGAIADWRKLTQVAPKTPAAESARLNLEKMGHGE
jgi:tetratricopeptide (TPR) repeat protein